MIWLILFLVFIIIVSIKIGRIKKLPTRTYHHIFLGHNVTEHVTYHSDGSATYKIMEDK